MTSKKILSSLLAVSMLASMLPTNLTTVAVDPPATVTITPDTSKADLQGSGSMTITLNIPFKNAAATDFDFAPPTALTYDGTDKTATVTAKDSVTGMGAITVHYYSDAAYTTEVTETKNVGTYYVGITLAAGTHYGASTSVIHKTDWKFEITKSTPTAPDAPTMASNTKNSITLTTVDGCEYSKDGTNWQDSPTFSGFDPQTEYTLYQRLKETANTNPSAASSAKFSTIADTYGMTITLQIKTLEVTAPTAKTGLKYTGQAQNLITAGSAQHGTIKYAVTASTVNTAPADSSADWKTVIPQETNVGKYKVWYKAFATENNYTNSEAAFVEVEIEKGNPLKKAPTSKNPTRYSSAVQLVNAGTTATEECTMYYLVADAKPEENAAEWSTAIPTANAKGTYKVWYKVTVTGNTNYADTAVCETPVIVTVTQYTAPTTTKSSQTWTLTMDSYPYDGTAHEAKITGNVYGKIIYYYYNADTDELLDQAPSEVGNYRVRVYASGSTSYYSRIQTAEYSITNPVDPIDENGMASVEKFKNSDTIPTVEGKIFAGWFTDETCTTPYTEDTGKAYAKFIDENILTVKAQISSSTTANSEKTSIRFITSVDSLKYQNVGFKITFNGKTIDKQMTKVYTALNANGKKISPKVFSEDSNYMEAYTLNNIPQSAFSKEFMVTPYYTTQDGTIVEGKTNTFTIANMIK